MTGNYQQPGLCAVLSLAVLAACAEPPIPPQFTEPTPLPLPSGEASRGPALSLGPDGLLALSWMERDEQGGTLRYSTLQDGDWQAASDVVTDPDMFVNWADIPSVAPVSGDHWLAHWMSKTAASTYAYDVKVSHSSDGGSSWPEPRSPHDDGTPTEHGFVSIVPADDKSRLIWLDGRKMANEATENSIDTSMTLRGAIVDVTGAVSDEQLIDDFVCDCCRTDMAITSNGPIAIYRNRTADEVRDIYVTRYIDGTWQPGVPLSNDNWVIAACPVNGPAIAAQGDLVAIAWFTAADDKPVVQLRISTDAGESFGEPILISRLNVIGQVDVEILDESTVAVSWLQKTRRLLVDQMDVRIMGVTIDGTQGKDQIVGRTAFGRVVPQMKSVGDKLIFVWTDANGGPTRLASVRMTVIPGVPEP